MNLRALPGAWVAMAGALLAGGAHALSISAPWDGQPQWWLQLFALEVLVRLVDSAPSTRAAALRGFLFALAWLGGTFWWLFISLHVYGGLPAVLAVLSVAALAALLALYYALAAGIVRHCNIRDPLGRALLWAALWTLAELARGLLFTGFPWARRAMRTWMVRWPPSRPGSASTASRPSPRWRPRCWPRSLPRHRAACRLRWRWWPWSRCPSDWAASSRRLRAP